MRLLLAIAILAAVLATAAFAVSRPSKKVTYQMCNQQMVEMAYDLDWYESCYGKAPEMAVWASWWIFTKYPHIYYLATPNRRGWVLVCDHDHGDRIDHFFMFEHGNPAAVLRPGVTPPPLEGLAFFQAHDGYRRFIKSYWKGEKPWR